LSKKAAPKKGSTGKSFPVIPAVLVVVVLLAVAAVVMTRGGGDEGADSGLQEVQPVSVSGASLPMHRPNTPDPSVGERAPEIEGSSFDGSAVTIGAGGRPELVIFLAHWCPHCQREVPRIAGWIEENGLPQGVQMYAVATGTSRDRPNYPPSAWLEREGLDIPTLADDADGQAGRAYGLSSFPYFVLLDGAGAVVERRSGEITIDELEQMLEPVATPGS